MIRPQSHPENVGPYRILGKLGTGAMGTVYRAVGEDGEVALKVIHPHLLERKGFFKRFRREAAAGSKVDHPNVVRTLDCDLLVVDGQPFCFLVLEYVEGQTLRHLLEEWEVLPEVLVREIAGQLAAGLTAIHEAGIVHRDLKPDNILYSDDQRVRIMDLGIAKVLDASEVLTQEGQFTGSLPYAAPEQLREDDIGPGADLYALGITLFELATGTNPFRRTGPGAVIQAHLSTIPPRARELNPDLSPFFTELTAVLMEKLPANRFPSADHLATALLAAESSNWWAARRQTLETRERRLPRIPVRRETPMFGRETELEMLLSLFKDAVVGGLGGAVLIEGEAGIGKTRLVDSVIRGLDVPDLSVLYGSYSPSGGLGALSEAVVGFLGEDCLEEELTAYLTATPALVPSFAALLKHDRPPEDGPILEDHAIQAAFCHLLRAITEERPLVWVIEDLHFAPRESRRLVLALARAVAGHRAMLVLTTRPELPQDELAEFTRLERVARARVGRLSPREVIDLIRDGLRNNVLADKLGARIAYKSDGVPFFVFEMIRGLKEGQFITELPDGSYVESRIIEEIAVPSVVRDLIEARLEDLSEEERAILDVGAVQGFEFDPALAAEVLGLARLPVLRSLAEMSRRSGVVLAEGIHYRFDHHQIQEVLYSDLPQSLKEEYHSLVAEALVAGLALEDPESAQGEDAHRIATHHMKGSRPPSGLPFLDRGLSHVEDAFRTSAALDLLDRALAREGVLSGTGRSDYLLRYATQLQRAGQPEAGLAAVEEALGIADAGGDPGERARVRVRLGGHLRFTGEFDRALAVLGEARELAEEAGDAAELGRAFGGEGTVLSDMGRYDDAAENYRRHLETAREGGDNVGAAKALANLGIHEYELGHPEKAVELLLESIELFSAEGDRSGEVSAGNIIGLSLQSLGRLDEARDRFECYLEFCREVGYRRGEAMALGNLGTVSHLMGDWGASLDQRRRALEIFRETGDPVQEVIARDSAAHLLLHLGAPAEAGELLEKALEIALPLGVPICEGHIRLTLGATRLREGDPETATALFEKAIEIRRAIGIEEQIASALLGLAEVRRSEGRVAEAEALIEEALGLVQAAESPATRVQSLTLLAETRPSAAAEARAAVEEHEAQLSVGDRLEARYRLWVAEGRPEDLAIAKRLLEEIRSEAPERYRDSLVTGVPIHRGVDAGVPPGEA